MSKNPDTKKRVLVCQNGARHRYAIPRILEEAGMLAALYTDSSAYSPFGKIAAIAGRLGIKHARLEALASRVPPGVPVDKVFSSDRSVWSALRTGAQSTDSSPDFQRWGLQRADVVYSMYGESLDFLKWAKEQGAQIIVDVFVHPSTNRIVAQEQVRYLSQQVDAEHIEAEDRHSKELFELADMLLCPSEWVAGGVREFLPASSDKVVVCPYGSSLTVKGRSNKPIEGSILFAGREPLRKGLHYLAEAAHLLRGEGLKIDVRVAGVTADEVSWIEHANELNCLGCIPLSEMQVEYCDADVFVLPSLSEGQAGVILEALACGCPVVSTRESGVDFDDNSGVTIPACDAVSLATELGKILKDRALRSELSRGALKLSDTFSMEAYEQRLIHAINAFH